MFSWIYSFFIPYLKDFVLVYKIIIKLVALFFILVEFSNMLKLFSNSYFWKPLPSKGSWMGDHTLYAQIENPFKHVHEYGDRYELYTWSSLYFQLVYQLIFSCLYTHLWFSIYVCFKTLKSINFYWYLLFHTYILLAQRPITLVLMMINSCSYSTNDLMFI